MPTTILKTKSPFKCLFGRSPDYKKLRIFGCQCYLWLKPYTTSKLQPKSMPCLFLGYSRSQNAYKCMFYLSQHVLFDECIFLFSTSAHVSVPSLSISSANTQDLAVLAVPSIGLIPSSHATVTDSAPAAPAPFTQPSFSPAQSQPAEIPPLNPLTAPTQSTHTHSMTTRSMNKIYKPKRLT